MKKLKNITWIAFSLLIIASCKKEEALNLVQPVGLGGDVAGSTAIDKWLLDSLTTPYNIAVKYRWDPWNASLFKTVTPPEENRVIPLFSALRRVWINPYNDETGSELFMKKYSPKQFVLIGSVEYDFYSVTLGQAEGGNNIVFFDVNQHFDQDPAVSIKRVIHTAHHEFAHILHQTVLYPQDFIGTSAKLGLANYTATWFNVSDAEALQEGYVTSYAMSNTDDDFVETISIMLTEGRNKFEEMKASANAVARQALQTKEDIVVTYYRQVWNIDFYSLQTRVQAALSALYPPPTVAAAYGAGLKYSRASVNPLNTSQLPQPAAFTTIYNNAKTGLSGVAPGGRILDSFAVIQNSTTTAQLRLYYRNSAGSAFQANWLYPIAKDATGFTFGPTPTLDGNAGVIAPGVTALVNYFTGNRFTIDWYANPNVSSFPRVKFTPVNTPGTYFIARLLP